VTHTERPTIDFGAPAVLAEFSMSPAYGGSEVFDDGSKVTFVQRDQVRVRMINADADAVRAGMPRPKAPGSLW
jgi:hypothetical protein